MLKAIISSQTLIETGSLTDSDHFSDIGLDSILLRRVVTEVNNPFGLNITPLEFHHHPSITKLAKPINSKLQGLNLQQPEQNNKPRKQSKMRGNSVNSHPRANRSSDPIANDDIAIIGMNGRFPKCPDIRSFWELLLHGLTTVTDYPLAR